MLAILREHGHQDLPKDARTLLQTPRSIATLEKCSGQYIYLGIKNGMERCLQRCKYINVDTIILKVNIDGLPIFKSTGLDIWPILGMIVRPRPFLIALYSVKGKPTNCEEFVQDFLNEFSARQFLKMH